MEAIAQAGAGSEGVVGEYSVLRRAARLQLKEFARWRNRQIQNTSPGFAKEHVNEICKEKFKCQDITCNKRHSKKCNNFNVYGKCKFTNCAYIHSEDEVNHKVEALKKCVKELKEEILQLIKKENNTHNQNIEELENQVIDLKDSVKKLASELKTTQLLIKQLDEKGDTE